VAQMAGDWGEYGSSRDHGTGRLDGFKDALDACLADTADAQMWPEADLKNGLLVIGGASEDIMRAVLHLAVESYRRGLHIDSGLSLTDWIAQRCPLLSKRIVKDVVAVARAWDIKGHEALRDALTPGRGLWDDESARSEDGTDGQAEDGDCGESDVESDLTDGDVEKPVTIGLIRGAQLVRALARVRPASTPEAYEGHVEVLTRYAAIASDRDLKIATDHLISVALTDEQVEAAAQRAFAARGVRESSLDGDLVRRFIITTDQEGAAVIQAILKSPLCAPAPDEEGADLRTATQRHHDGLFTVLRRGVSSPGSAPTTSKAKVFVTMPLSALMAATRTWGTRGPGGRGGNGKGTRAPGPAGSDATGGVGATSGSGEYGGNANGGGVSSIGDIGRGTGPREPEINRGGRAGLFARPGAGHTFTGQTLTPGQVRRMACDADIIPVVLGTMSEVVDVGRESRLATPGQLKKLWLRDHECTYPGCSVPNTWCDAHHVAWWSRNGRTDIDNLALLCGRHHTIVHERDLIATFDNHTPGASRPGDHSPSWHM